MDTICICKPNSSSHNGVGIFRSTRKLPPAHYLFKIESYSLFMNKKTHVSGVFQSGGYKWNLVLHPVDNSKSKDKGHVSLMLRIADSEKFSHGWELNVNFKMFVYDQIHKNYLTIQDTGGAVRTFKEKNTELGFEQLISSKDLLSSSNGYFVNDSCEFGVEVFVIGRTTKSEIISMVKNPTHDSFSWKLGNFSSLHNSSYQYTKHVGERDWTLWVYPRGNGFASRDHLSVYLELKNCAANRTVYATYTLKIVNQKYYTSYHVKTGSAWFSPTSAINEWKALAYNWFGYMGNAWGFPKFISLSDLNKGGNGCIRDNALSIEVEIEVSMTRVSS